MEETYYFNHMFQMNRKFTRDKVENMNNEINNIIRKIKSKNLSPIEQVMYVYDYVKSFEFSKDGNSIDTRQVDSVINSKKAVCAGYSDTFNEILRRMGFKTAIIESYVGEVSHMNPIVEIVDPKYGINGIYNFDPTYESSNANSYAFFGRTMEEFDHLRQKRKGRGCSLALTEGNTGSETYEQVLNDLPLRTMNIINGFFPIQENFDYLKKIYSDGSDKSKWKDLNSEYSFQLFNLGFKVRRSERISTETLETIISNVLKTKMSDEELSSKLLEIKKETNENFRKNYDDPRLIFNIESKNYIRNVDYNSYIQKVEEFLSSKKEDEEIISMFTFLNGQDRKIIHRLFKNNIEGNQILSESEFDYDYDFGKKLLNPMLEKYISHCDFPTGEISKPEYANFNIRDYKMISSSGYSLSMEACDLEFLKTLDIYIKKKNMMQEMNQNMSTQEYETPQSGMRR